MESDRGTNRCDATVDIEQSGLEQTGTATAAFAYTGNRFEVHVAHTSGIDPYGANGAVAGFGQQQSSLQVASAIAFADGKIAIGAPVRGDAFAIVYPYTNLADADVVVGDKEAPRAYADSWGPALVGDIPAFAPTSLPVDVPDLPLGYSLGQGTFDLTPPLHGGYALEVGSSHSVSAYGTLLGSDGLPVALMTGTATSASDPTRQSRSSPMLQVGSVLRALHPDIGSLIWQPTGDPRVTRLTFRRVRTVCSRPVH
jgi:outer membrane usher protein